MPSHTFPGLNRVLGFLQAILGLACISIGIGAVVRGAQLATIGHGIWGGTFILLAGFYGFTTSDKQSSIFIQGTLVMSFIASAMGAAIGIISSIALTQENCFQWYCEWHSVRLALNAMLTITGYLAMMFSIIQTALSCGPVCEVSPTVVTHPAKRRWPTAQPVGYSSSARQQEKPLTYKQGELNEFPNTQHAYVNQNFPVGFPEMDDTHMSHQPGLY